MTSPTPSSSTSPDWLRLQKALSVEADRGFNDLEGKQYRFSEFLSFTLNQPPTEIPPTDQRRWKDLGDQFTSYSELGFAQRQHLVAETRRFLHQTQRSWEAKGAGAQAAKTMVPKTTPIAATSIASPSPHLPQTPPSTNPISLDQSLTYLPGVGPKSAEKLAKLGLITVRDLLFYYPRDHVDYARQVNIRDLTEGETVTLVATVKRCECFTSPRNNKLTIVELVVRDQTGQLSLSRFMAGSRYANRGWQEQQKRQYPAGSTIAASGLVKRTKSGGVTLDNPQIELLQQAGDSIDSLKIGRIVPIYALTDGVPADLVRRAVIAALPAVPQIQEALPDRLRSQYSLTDIQTAIAHIHFPPESAALACGPAAAGVR